MSDYDDDTFFVMLARFTDLFVAHCNLALDPRKAKAASKRFAKQAADAVAQRDEAQAQRDAAKSEAAELVAKAHQEVEAIHIEAQRRLEAVEAAEQDLAQREQRIARLEAAWRNIGEPADVMSGFRAAEHTPLQKARLAHGRQPGKDLDPLSLSEPDAAADVAIDALIRRDVGDARSDAQGNAFAPSTLTRSTEHKRGAQ